MSGFFVAIVVGTLCNTPGPISAEDLVVENDRVKLVLREDLRGVAQLIDKQTGRDYAAAQGRGFGLYALYFGKEFDRAKRSATSNIASKELTRIENGVRIRFDQKGPHPALVDCTITAPDNEPGIHFHIDVASRCSQPLCAIDYPLFTCRAQLDDDSEDDRVLYPQCEGILLCDPQTNMRTGAAVAKPYPGLASAQFMYYFDPAGGFYCGAHDPQGWTKVPLLQRKKTGLLVTWRHELPSLQLPRTKIDYAVVWSVGGPTWQEGADIYRDWAEKNAPWCEKKIRAGTTPDWLQRTNVFLNYSITSKGEFRSAEETDAWLRAYRELLRVPVVACAFGWEKHGAWIGPDYFPPRGGEDYYIELAHKLAERDDHMQLFTSGFRWGVWKPRPAQQPRAPRPQTGQASPARRQRDASQPQPTKQIDTNDNFIAARQFGIDARGDYFARGKKGAVLNPAGRDVLDRRPWAHNYLLCAGSKVTRDLIGGCFQHIYDWGVAGIDLDQNIGGGIPHCYSDTHGHPPGAGHWQYHAVYDFLKDVRATARVKHPDSFIGVEEPGEAFIPVIDIAHGRAFTDTEWPANGPGAVSVPLFIYLYHQYQMNYAGWIDGKFSPFGDTRIGLGRAIIFGMQPGVRIDQGPFHYDEGEPSAELTMLRDAARIMQRCEDYLLQGRMLHDPLVTGAPNINRPFLQNRTPLPLDWPVVQATAWRSAAGNVCYAIANLSGKKRTVQLAAQRYQMRKGVVRLTRIDAAGDQLLRVAATLPFHITLELEPWQICCVEQR